MRPKRSLLGQIFLKDKKYITKIANSIDIGKGRVLEIGGGDGALTSELASKVTFLTCVEFDERLAKLLKSKFSKYNNVKIIHSDILKFSLSSLSKNTSVIGNVPYHISSKLIKYLINNRQLIDKAYLTFQREFAHRLVAKQSMDGYGYLSCLVQYYSKVTKLFDIPPCAFSPQPKVASSLIKIEFHKKLFNKAKDERILFDIIQKAFSQRRKKIINLLPTPFKTKDFLSSLGIDSKARPTNLSLTDYISIANKLSQ